MNTCLKESKTGKELILESILIKRSIFVSLYSVCSYFWMDYNYHSYKTVSLSDKFWVKLLISDVWRWPNSVEIRKSEIRWKENIIFVPGCGQMLSGEKELKGKKSIHFLACPSNISIDLCQEGSRIHSHDFTNSHGKRRTFSFKLRS